MILSLQSDLLEGAVAPGGPGTTRLLPTEMVKLLDLLHWLACKLVLLFIIDRVSDQCQPHLSPWPGRSAHRAHRQPDALPGAACKHCIIVLPQHYNQFNNGKKPGQIICLTICLDKYNPVLQSSNFSDFSYPVSPGWGWAGRCWTSCCRTSCSTFTLFFFYQSIS